MSRAVICVLWGGLFLFGFQAVASVSAGVSGIYLTDEFSTATTASSSKAFYGGNLLFGIDRRDRFYAGFHVHQLSFDETSAGVTTSLMSLDMGGYVLAYLDQKKIYSVGFGYNPFVTGTYTKSSVNQSLTGSSIMGTLGAAPEISRNLFLGIDLSYIQLEYDKATVGSVATDVSYRRTFILPTLSLLWRN